MIVKRDNMKKKLDSNYFKYINSDAWFIKRSEALEFHGRKCKSCGSKNKLDVHHLTYERFGNELLKDLTILCRQCHELTHLKLNDANNWRPKKKFKYLLPKNQKANVKLKMEKKLSKLKHRLPDRHSNPSV